MREDASYEAKIGLVRHAVQSIHILKDSLNKINSHARINNIRDIAGLNEYCSSGNAPSSFRRPIEVYEMEDGGSDGPLPQNLNMMFSVPGSPGSFDSSSPRGGCTDKRAINYNPNAEINDGSCIYSKTSNDGRCIYRDPTCIGEQDSITLEDITKNNINNVVRVDKKCYDANELQTWLVNNPTVPHNRKRYTSKELNKCVEDGEIHNKINNSMFSPSKSTSGKCNNLINDVKKIIHNLLEKGENKSFFSDQKLIELCNICPSNERSYCINELRMYVNNYKYNINSSASLTISPSSLNSSIINILSPSLSSNIISPNFNEYQIIDDPYYPKYKKKTFVDDDSSSSSDDIKSKKNKFKDDSSSSSEKNKLKNNTNDDSSSSSDKNKDVSDSNYIRSYNNSKKNENQNTIYLENIGEVVIPERKTKNDVLEIVEKLKYDKKSIGELFTILNDKKKEPTKKNSKKKKLTKKNSKKKKPTKKSSKKKKPTKKSSKKMKPIKKSSNKKKITKENKYLL